MKSYSNLAVLSVISLISTHIATAFEIDYATVRFTPWDKLTKVQRNNAIRLKYNSTTWNKPGSNDIEWNSWWYQTNRDYFDLDGDGDESENQPLFKQFASKVGFSGVNGIDMWDCWSSHYSYSWANIVKYDLQPSAADLGWTEQLWNSDPPEAPASSNKTYAELTDTEKTAAGVFCYTKSLWDEDELPFAIDSPREFLLGTNSRTCDWASQDLERCNKNDDTVSKHCCNTCGSCDEYECVNTPAKFLYSTRKSDGKKKYKMCGFMKGTNRIKRCQKIGMEATCPTKCNRKCRLMIT